MVQQLRRLAETPSQTAGPYVHIGCIPTFTGINGVYPEDLGLRAVEEGAAGETITVTGRMHDGTGWAFRDAMVESWQADANGLYPGQPGADPSVNGFCRFAADGQSGEFNLRTIKPGRTKLRDGREQAPHIALWITARGINVGLQTRIYFDDEDNSQDPVLTAIEQKHRIDTLIAKRTGTGQYRFDIFLQGANETVFLDM